MCPKYVDEQLNDVQIHIYTFRSVKLAIICFVRFPKKCIPELFNEKKYFAFCAHW